MSPIAASSQSSNGSSPATGRKRLLDRPLARKIAARYTKKFWGDWLPFTSRISPKILARFSGMMNPDDFARGIADTPVEQLEAAMQSPLRSVVLDEVVSRMENEFAPERAGDLDAIFHFLITGRPDGGNDEYQLTIRNGTCVNSKTLSEEPKIVLTLDAVSFLQLVTSVTNGVNLYIGGKLKIDGAMLMGTRMTNMFNIPGASPAPVAPSPVAS